MRRLTLAAALALLPAAAWAAEPLRIGIDQLLPRLPAFFGEPVTVEGMMQSWGDTAVLVSATGRDIMVDLRPLDAELRARLGRDCLDEAPCAIAVTGTIRHLRAPQLSELGIEAESVALR